MPGYSGGGGITSNLLSALSIRVDVVSQAVSVVSQALSILSVNYTSLVNRVSTNSAAGGGGNSGVAQEAPHRIA